MSMAIGVVPAGCCCKLGLSTSRYALPLKDQYQNPPMHSFFPNPKIFSSKFPKLSIISSPSEHRFHSRCSSSPITEEVLAAVLGALQERTGVVKALFEAVGVPQCRIFIIRIVLRDDDGLCKLKLDDIVKFFEAWNPTVLTSTGKHNHECLSHVFNASVGFLLDNMDRWICSSSYVCFSYKQLYDDFSEVMEPFNLSPSETTKDEFHSVEVTKNEVDCVELFLKLTVAQEINHIDIHTREDLEALLQQLMASNSEGYIVSAIPKSNNIKVDKEKLDQVQGYFHVAVGERH